MPKRGLLPPVLMLVIACGNSGSGDAGARDGGARPRDAAAEPDAGPSDSGVVDTGGAPDSGDTPLDGGGGSDASPEDAASVDAASMDSSTPDADGMDTGEPDAADAGAADSGTNPNCPDLVTVTFAGEIATVAGTPLGLDNSVRTSSVSGSLTYDRCVVDQRNGDPTRGKYDHASYGTAAFQITAAGLDVRGSTRPVLEVEDLSSDTFRYRDGPQFADPTDRTMTVDGVPTADLELFIAITDGSGAAFPDDDLPAIFPYIPIASFPHTFSLSDDDGTLLMQLDDLQQP